MDIQRIYIERLDLHFLFQDQRFLWDTEKASINITKHGVNFETACEVFFDPFVLVEDASVEDERRDAAIGLAEDWSLLFVVHMQREGDEIRIISARLAAPHERRSYEDND